MRGGPKSSWPLTPWIAVGLITVLAGCTGTLRSAGGPGASEPIAIISPSPSPSPSSTLEAEAVATPTRTLPLTVVGPSSARADESTLATPPPTASPSPTATPKPTPAYRYDPPPRRGPFQMNLYRRGDFATQVTKIYCVPGAMQTMMNVMERGATKASRQVQDRLYRLSRRLSTDRLRGQGAEPEGWARGLERLGYGDFEVVAAGSRNGAIRAAARAIRRTNRPVGLLVWRGAHAWVMTGFKATADPASGSRFEVTHVRIVDVWYPRVSSIWGASVRPNTLVPVGKLDEDYLPWRRPSGPYPGKDRRFVLVVPVAGS